MLRGPRMRTIMAVMILLPALAHADDVVAAPQAQQVTQDHRPYWDTCRHVWARAPYVAYRLDAPLYVPNAVSVPTGTPTPSGGGGTGASIGSLGGGGRPEALLILAVVAL